ncbi:MAG TPA: rhodanese-like domain-containing protein [Azospira sp.]|nr:rhodanese-like domain-containing protein [Azospira sp.]
MRQITASELAEWLAAAGRQERPGPVLLDVREPWELEICRLDGARALPMAALPPRLHELDPDAETVVVCHHGVRSFQVALFLERNGFASVFNLSGGVAAWAEDVDPSMQRY